MFDFLRRFVDDIATFVFGSNASNAPQRPDLTKLAAGIDAAPVREGAAAPAAQVEQSQLPDVGIIVSSEAGQSVESLKALQAFKGAIARQYVDNAVLPAFVRKAENDLLNSTVFPMPTRRIF